ncbi:sigma-54 interaction domain-containing protein [Sandarakinorhabdus rubra]|uniref:sigma-54 interaction domain-containing protein n=1 Tax=Sandarakinorhabdus rubra TaxID=2672568 RepID=UPI0013DCA587|nr:sigma 54-interacting transcriptional regulator [Sandarakinorhabdus rubra]
MSTPVPALPPPAFLPGLAGLDLSGIEVCIGDQRLPGPALESRCPEPRRLVLVDAAHGQASLCGDALTIAVAPGNEDWALALAAAFAARNAPVAADPASAALLALARRVGATPTPVLIEGATGTGKEGLARLVHDASPRRSGPFVAVNCAALPEAMVEATLFGHERGAFTGAHAAAPGLFRSANGGTLFLDEVAELPAAAQAKLLRVLQEREVLAVGATRPVPIDVRLVAAGNRDLAAEVAAGRFRADLYWRLAVFPLRTLPLAERPADILAIAAHWLLRRAEAGGLVPWLLPCARAALLAHDWPGNVRELGNVLDRALVLADSPAISARQLMIDPAPGRATPLRSAVEQALPGQVRAAEAEVIARALAASPNRRAAARRLGISERTLRYKLARSRSANDIMGHDAMSASGAMVQ